MAYLPSSDRFQITFSSLEETIEKDNPVRFIDAFVDKLDLSRLNFQKLDFVPSDGKEPAVAKVKKVDGRPSYELKVFLKIYLYGYLNGIRSSRKLEKECIRNLELHWLLGKLQPNHHSIADFRKVNPAALKSTFKLFVLFCKDADLITGEVVAIDGTKFRASNSKKANYSQAKIDRHLAYIEEKTNEYLGQLDANDLAEQPEKIKQIEQKIEKLKGNKIKYEILQEKLQASGEPQISTTDPDARALLVQGQVVEVSFNLQVSVDQKHKLPVATQVINRNDRNALSDIAQETLNNLEPETLTVLVDKGYHNGREIQTCQKANIKTIVATPELIAREGSTQTAYLVSQFVYNKEADTYTCPAGQTLSTKGTWHKKSRELNQSYQFKKYRTTACQACPVRDKCTSRADGGREIERSEYADAVELNAKNYKENAQLYRQRQEINEHVFGTLKRQWNMHYTNLRGLDKIGGETALMLTVYNIKRSLNILGLPTLLEKLQTWVPNYEKATCFTENRPFLRPIQPRNIFEANWAA